MSLYILPKSVKCFFRELKTVKRQHRNAHLLNYLFNTIRTTLIPNFIKISIKISNAFSITSFTDIDIEINDNTDVSSITNFIEVIDIEPNSKDQLVLKSFFTGLP